MIIESSNTTEPLPRNIKYLAPLCHNSTFYNCKQITCSHHNQPLLAFPYCATYSNDTKLLSLFESPYCKPNVHKTTAHKQIILPRNLSQLDDYMCSPMNRKGHLCSECAKGFGPSVTSFGYRCVNCTDTWYRVLIFLFIKFAPITVLYLIILIFQISITSAPMPCFILCAQFIVTFFNSTFTPDIVEIFLKTDWSFRLDMQIMLTLYGILNLDFCQYDILPPYCVSTKLKPINIAFLDYISAFYPILLIFLTWLCVELHDRNFRLLVWLWRPFHGCFVRLRRGLDTKSDIIDVFTTFFTLSYSKILYQTEQFTVTHIITNINEAGRKFEERRLLVDPSITYGGSHHLAFVIPSLFISVLNILPPLLLTLYPIRAFRSCLSKFNLNLSAVHIFTDKVYSCYRNGLDGGRDMRSISGLYFFLRPVVYLLTFLLHHFLEKYVNINIWFVHGTMSCTISLLIAFAKPYKKCYMNFLDAILFFYFAIILLILSQTRWRDNITLFIARMVLSTPIILFLLVITLKMIYATIIHIVKVCRNSLKLPCTWFRGTALTAESTSDQNAFVGSQAAAKPLIQPTSTVISYGADDQ